MGAFFTSLHVLAPPSLDGLAEARAVLEADARTAGLHPAGPGQAADREAVLRSGGRWLSIYDTCGEGPDEVAVGRLVGALSTALDTSVFWVLVHDSRVLRLGLFVKGAYRDLYDSRQSGGDHLGAWRHLLAPDGSEEMLAGVFERRDRFVEDALPGLARALGLTPGRLSTGSRYLLASGVPHEATRLCWVGGARASAGDPPALETPPEHLARVYAARAEPEAPVEAAVGGPVRFGVTALNRGGAGTGLVVQVRGGDPVVRWGRVRLILGDPRAGRAVDALLVEEGDHQVARFPGAALPEGSPGERLPADPSAAWSALRARLATCVQVNVLGTVRASGRATVEVRLEPTRGSGVVATGEVVGTLVEEHPAAATALALPREAAVLAERSCLVALVVLEPERAEERAAEVVAALRGAVPDAGEVRTTRYPMPGLGHPQLTTGAAAGFLDGGRWPELLDAVAGGLGKVDAEWLSEADGVEPVGRLAFGIGITPPRDPLPVLSIGLRGGDLDRAEADLTRALDVLAGDAGLVQAFLTRWGELLDLEVTPWEVARGIHGQITLDRAWATRWLRAVAPGRLWLGPDLQARLEVQAVTAALETRWIGPTLRLDIRRTDVAEDALRRAIPAPTDWKRAIAAVSNRL